MARRDRTWNSLVCNSLLHITTGHTGLLGSNEGRLTPFVFTLTRVDTVVSLLASLWSFCLRDATAPLPPLRSDT